MGLKIRLPKQFRPNMRRPLSPSKIREVNENVFHIVSPNMICEDLYSEDMARYVCKYHNLCDTLGCSWIRRVFLKERVYKTKMQSIDFHGYHTVIIAENITDARALVRRARKAIFKYITWY